MAIKRQALGASLKGKMEQAATGAEPAPPEPVEQTAPTQPKRYIPPSREHKRQLTVWLSPEALKQLKQMALDDDTTVQAVVTDALNAAFAKNGKPQIA